MNEIQLTIAAATFALKPADPSVRLALHPVYQQFMGPTQGPTTPAATYTIVQEPPSDWQSEPVVESVWDSFIWRLGRLANGDLQMEIRLLPGDEYIPTARLRPDFSAGTILARRRHPQPEYALNHPEEQQIFLNRLAYLDAGLIHSSSVVVDGKGYLFCGRSGAGKTTIGRQWKAAGFRMLCDDRNIVRMINGAPYLCGTPWHGEDPEVHAENVPLGGVFHLNQSPDNRLDPLSHVQAVARLQSNTLAPFALEDGTARVLDAYGRALESVPSYRIYFTPDQRPVNMCLAEVMRTAV